MNHISTALEIEHLNGFTIYLLFVSIFVGSFLGYIIGWYLRGRYEALK